MRDLDRILADDVAGVARAAADAARVPEYAEVARRGRRRRNVRHGVALGAAALAVVTILGVGQALGSHGGREPAPVQPADNPTDTSTDVVTAEQIVDAPDSRPVDVAKTAADIGVRAVVWEGEAGAALAVTDDWFRRNRTVFGVEPGAHVIAAGRGRFVVGESDSVRVVDAEGGDRTVAVTGPEGPVARGEVAVVIGSPAGGLGVIAVDAETAVAHPVYVPGGAYEIRVFGGRITTLHTTDTGSTVVQWSDDGGATWTPEEVAAGDVPVLVPSGHGQDVVLLETGGGPSPPITAIHRYDGTAWQSTPYDGALPATLNLSYDDRPFDGAFLLGGEVFVFATIGDRDDPEAAGIFRFVDGGLVPVESGAPEFTDQPDPNLVEVTYGSIEPLLWIATADGGLMFSSDGGISFEPLDGR